jgi:hydroxyacylglutathione hydrolase
VTPLEIQGVRALKDNYVWLVIDRERGEAAAVDPSEAAPVAEAAARLGVRLVEIWNTHHHWDHVGGNRELDVPVVRASTYDGEQGRVPGQTHRLGDGDRFTFAGREVRAMAIPAHTLGHVAYRVDDLVFPGDTLFGAGCGRLFEGTPAQMHAALSRLRALPDATRVYCGHEYTLHNLKFAAELEPANEAVRARLERVRARPGDWTVPLDLGEEKGTNPFLRFDDAALARVVGEDEPVAVFAAVRRRKDAWRET